MYSEPFLGGLAADGLMSAAHVGFGEQERSVGDEW